MVHALRQAEAGTPAVEVCRTRGGQRADLLPVEAAVCGNGGVALRRLRQVEEENRTRKQLVADLSLDKPMLQEALRNTG